MKGWFLDWQAAKMNPFEIGAQNGMRFETWVTEWMREFVCECVCVYDERSRRGGLDIVSVDSSSIKSNYDVIDRSPVVQGEG